MFSSDYHPSSHHEVPMQHRTEDSLDLQWLGGAEIENCFASDASAVILQTNPDMQVISLNIYDSIKMVHCSFIREGQLQPFHAEGNFRANRIGQEHDARPRELLQPYRHTQWHQKIDSKN